MSKVKISASMSHMDYGHLYDQIAEASTAGVDYIHLDAADMTSIPNHELMGGGAGLVEGIRPATSLPIEVHTHVHGATPTFINGLADAGANMIILPAIYYLDANIIHLIQTCHDRGMKFGLTITMGAPLCLVDEAIYWLDRLHIHTHDAKPGIPLRETAMPMIRRAREMIDQRKLTCELACDGGITPENLYKCVDAGTDVVVMGRQIFKAEDGITAAVKRIHVAIDNAMSRSESINSR
jgi:ribulose-phosphate 3-epimerase